MNHYPVSRTWGSDHRIGPSTQALDDPGRLPRLGDHPTIRFGAVASTHAGFHRHDWPKNEYLPPRDWGGQFRNPRVNSCTHERSTPLTATVRARISNGILPWFCSAAAAVGLLASGCASRNVSSGRPVADAWREPKPAVTTPAIATGALSGAIDRSSIVERPPIVEVNATRLSRAQFVDVLVQSHGLELLESVIVREAARQLAEERGIEVTRDAINRARDAAIMRLAGPATSTQPSDDRLEQGERILNHFLRDKRIGYAEWMLGIERTTYLREIVARDVSVGELDLRAEYARRYGAKVQVRHIQLESVADVKKVQDLLKKGNQFETLARKFSQNDETAVNGGLLPPFVAGDPALPPLFSITAFTLEPEQVSAPIRESAWYHLIRLERRFPPSEVEFRHVRDELVEPARERLILEKIQQLGKRLFTESQVRIFDDDLSRRFRDRYPRRGESGS